MEKTEHVRAARGVGAERTEEWYKTQIRKDMLWAYLHIFLLYTVIAMAIFDTVWYYSPDLQVLLVAVGVLEAAVMTAGFYAIYRHLRDNRHYCYLEYYIR